MERISKLIRSINSEYIMIKRNDRICWDEVEPFVLNNNLLLLNECYQI